MIGVMKRRKVVQRNSTGWAYVSEAAAEVGVLTVFLDLLITVWNLGSVGIDMLMLALPQWMPRRGFAFVFHAPFPEDPWRPFPVLWYLPMDWQLIIMRYMPPCRLGWMKWRSGRGRIFGIMMTPIHISRFSKAYPYYMDRGERERLIKRLVKLAERWGASRVAMGAYLPSLMQQGTVLADDPAFARVGLTIGHACTAWAIREYLYNVAQRLDLDFKNDAVAIVGAAGSTGATVARILAHDRRVRRLVLVDIVGKEPRLQAITRELQTAHDKLSITIATDFSILPLARVVITVTTAPGSIIEPHHIGEGGTIYIDDSMPPNTKEDVLGEVIKEGKLLVLKVWTRIQGLRRVTFDYDLDPLRPEITWTCAAEGYLLHVGGVSGNYSIGTVSVEQVLEVERLAREHGVMPAPPMTFKGRRIEDSEFETLRAHIRESRRSHLRCVK